MIEGHHDMRSFLKGHSIRKIECIYASVQGI